MSKSGLFNKKFIIIAISILVIIAIVVGCVFIFRPKVDLSAPYNDTYSLVYDEDYNYVIERDEAVYDTLSSLTNVSSEDYQSTVQAFRDINTLIQTITDNNTFILENLTFWQLRMSKCAPPDFQNVNVLPLASNSKFSIPLK